MSQLPLRVLYYGKDEPLPEQTQLHAGPLSMVFEAGDLRYIRFGDHEILRRIYVAIRDRNWDTILPQLANVQIERDSNTFRITYDVENKHAEVDFFWQGTITGDADGTITFSMDGEARSTFRRNRIGFCVLHPMACAGVPCRIEKADGTVEESAYPIAIAPQLLVDGEIKPVAPFNNMRAVRYEVTAGVEAEVRFEGEIFEMEDQRNWTDASYKTYGTPLSEPFPVEVPAGTKISQRITLTLKTQRESSSATRGATAQPLTFGISSTEPLPRIGLGVASHGEPLSVGELERLKVLNLSHLRVDIDLTQPDYESTLRRATDEAQALGVSLELALFLTDAAAEELQGFATVIERVQPPIGTYLIFHKTEASTSAQWVGQARRYLTGVKIGAGSNAYFTDLNRGRPPVDALDLVCYSINPQVHAFDNSSLIETLEAQAATVESARQFAGGLPIVVTPVTLLARFNPNATGPEPEPAPGELPAQVDIRQISLFSAGWTLGSIKYLSESGASTVTYYETTGWRGVMETVSGSPLPEKFRSLPGAVFPLYHILADVGEFVGGEVLVSKSSDSLKVEGIALRKTSKTRTLLANLTPDPQQVSVQNLAGVVRVRHLNETNAQYAMASPEAFREETSELVQTTNGTLEFNLFPYAVVQIDGTY